MQSWNINHSVAAGGPDGGLSVGRMEKYMHLQNVIHPTACRLIGFALFLPFLASHKPCFEMETEGHTLLSASARGLLKSWYCGSRPLVISKHRTHRCTLAGFPQLTALHCLAGKRPWAKTHCHSEPNSPQWLLSGKWKYLSSSAPVCPVPLKRFSTRSLLLHLPHQAGRAEEEEAEASRIGWWSSVSCLMLPPLTLWCLSSPSSRWQACCIQRMGSSKSAEFFFYCWS